MRVKYIRTNIGVPLFILETTIAELNSDDRYQLRKLQMDVDKKELAVQKAKQNLERFILALEHRYDSMGPDQVIGPRTGTIRVARPRVTGKAALKRC